MRAAEDFHQGTFASAIFPDEDMHFAWSDLEGNIFQRTGRAEAFLNGRHAEAGDRWRCCIHQIIKSRNPWFSGRLPDNEWMGRTGRGKIKVGHFRIYLLTPFDGSSNFVSEISPTLSLSNCYKPLLFVHLTSVKVPPQNPERPSSDYEKVESGASDHVASG